MLPTSTFEENLKTKSVVQMPAYTTYDYLLTISPHQDLWNRIITIKQAFAKKYNCPMAFGTLPQITLLKFMQLHLAEDKIVNRLRSIATSQPPIKIELKDFGTYPAHTIYINVASKVPLLNLAKTLKEVQPLLKYSPDAKPFVLSEPQITIARKLLPWQYEKAWMEFSNSTFSGRFIAGKMTLLKRKVDNLSYQHVTDFNFLNTPTAATQGALFA